MQLRENKMYMRRDGRIVGPAKRNEMPNEAYPWMVDGWLYCNDGMSCTRRALDLIDEVEVVFSGSSETFTDQNIEQLLDLIRPKHAEDSDWNNLRQWVLDAYHNKPIECEPFERNTVNRMVALVRSAEKELVEHGLTFDQWLAKYSEAVRSMLEQKGQ